MADNPETNPGRRAMTTHTAQPNPKAFGAANPHPLSIILEPSESQRIIAANDIFDVSGIKLWASQQPVSAERQRKLLDRKRARRSSPAWSPKLVSPRLP